jgi:SAM-dependent methyltransferase
MSDDIYLDGEQYDRLFGGAGAAEDMPFWIDQARRYGDPILELTCGTGRVAIPLAQEGFRVTGVDRAEGMLREARRKSAEENADVEWVRADVRDFSLGKTFALIILPANALIHLLHLSDLEACLACVRAHLAPEGRFIVDVFVPKAELLVNRPGERSTFAEYDDPDGGGKIVVTQSYVYEPDTQIKRVKTYRPVRGEDAEIEGELTVRMYFPQELDALFKYNGFEIEAKYDSYERTPFGPESEKQLIICRKAS